MDIYIKSFNRPFYLERCIKSIKKFVKNYKYIYILDDGTGSKYLEKLKILYPDIKFVVSPAASRKYEYITMLIKQNGNIEPTSFWGKDEIYLYKKDYIFTKKLDPALFWLENIKSSDAPYFLLLEDDLWFTDEIDLQKIQTTAEKYNLVNIKLMWMGNSIISGEQFIKDELDITDNFLLQLIYPDFIEKIRKWNFFTPAFNYLISKYRKKFDAWSVYQIAGGIYRRDYWLYCWAGIPRWNDEGYQLKKSLEYVAKKNTIASFAKSNKEVLKHGWTSSVTLRPIDIDNDFNVLMFNEILSGSWLEGKINVMQNFPDDFMETYIEKCLINSKTSSNLIMQWKQWKHNAIDHFNNIGFKI